MAYVPPHIRTDKETYKPDKFEIGLTDKALGSFRDAKPVNPIIKKYVKSCQAYLSLSDYDLTVTEMLKFPNIEKNKSGTLEDNFLDDLINNFKLKERYTDTPIYCGEVELYSIVKANQTVKTPKDEKKKINYNCKIDRETFSVEPEMKLRMYFQQIAQTELKKINSIFWWKTKKFIITPQQPFSPEIEQQWDTIQKTSPENPEKKHIVKSFLGFVKFQYYSKILTINELFDDNFDVKKLEDIKTNIKIFYKRNFDYDITNDYMLYITLNNSNDNTNQLVFDFYTYDATLGYLYVSFIDRQTNPRIEIIIDRIKNKNFYYYGNNDSKKDCIPASVSFTEPLGILLKEDIIYKENIYKDIFKISKKTKKIKIINEYNSPNKYHTYCAIYLLIQIDDNYYEISIKSITAQIIWKYEKYRTLKYKDFYEKYKKCLELLLTKPPITQYKDIKYLCDKLPAYIELYVKPISIDEYTFPINIYYIDTAKNYWDNILPYIIKEASTTLDVILCLLWGIKLIKIYRTHHINQTFKETQKMYLLNKPLNKPYKPLADDQLYFLKLTQALLKTTTGYYIIGYIEYNMNFIQVVRNTCNFDIILKKIINNTPIDEIQSHINKLTRENNIRNFVINPERDLLEQFIDYINNISKDYLVWYSPKIEIKENQNDNLLTFIKKYEASPDSKTHYKEEISKLTNFYDLYKKDDFCHNVRHLTDNLKRDLKHFTTNPNYDYGCHYPNHSKYGIFHLHVNKRTFTTEKIEVQVKNYHNINSLRHILLLDILSIDFSIIDIRVSVPLQLKITDFIDFDIKKIDKNILLQKFRKFELPEPKNIFTIFENNGFIIF
jgi:hypothetical protein